MDDSEDPAAEQMRRIIGQSAMRSMELTNEQTAAALRRFGEAVVEVIWDLRFQGWSNQRILMGLNGWIVAAVIGPEEIEEES